MSRLEPTLDVVPVPTVAVRLLESTALVHEAAAPMTDPDYTLCEIRFVWRRWPERRDLRTLPMAVEVKNAVDCMACVAYGAEP